MKIRYVDRSTGKESDESIYGEFFIKWVYGPSLQSRFIYATFLQLLCRLPIFSHLYGLLQKSRRSQKKIAPFLERFQMDASQFQEPISSFSSFNDFFIRTLKKEARPIDSRPDVVIAPADGRYLVYPQLATTDGFLVKGIRFTLSELLRDEDLASRYADGSMVIIRLCPSDYHRYHFPYDVTVSHTTDLQGPLFSVNPFALKKNIHILTENKKRITHLRTKGLGDLLYIAVGATCVGSIHNSYQENKSYRKGDELGYFSFGGSCLILLFEKGRMTFDSDLVANSEKKIETLVLFGTSLGRRTD